MDFKVSSDYLHWVHKSTAADPAREKYTDEQYGKTQWDSDISLWIAADQLGDCRPRNVVIDAMPGLCETSTIVPSHGSINMAWDNSVSNSTLRRLLLDCYMTQTKDFEHVQKQWVNYDESFLQELIVRTHSVAREMSTGKGEWMYQPHHRSRFHYHEHDEQVPMCHEDHTGEDSSSDSEFGGYGLFT